MFYLQGIIRFTWFILIGYNHNKSVRFRSLHLILWGSGLPISIQINARKTHADTWACINLTWIDNDFWKCPVFKESSFSAYNAIIYICCLSVVLCHRRWLVDLIFFYRSRLADTLLPLLRLGEGRYLYCERGAFVIRL